MPARWRKAIQRMAVSKLKVSAVAASPTVCCTWLLSAASEECMTKSVSRFSFCISTICVAGWLMASEEMLHSGSSSESIRMRRSMSRLRRKKFSLRSSNV